MVSLWGAIHVPALGDRLVMEWSDALSGAGDSRRGRLCIRAEDVSGGDKGEAGGKSATSKGPSGGQVLKPRSSSRPS